MGTQQMLLVVLGVIIVGIAIVVGAMPTLENGAKLSNRDAITQDCMKMAAAAQGYYLRPRLLNGGGRSFAGITARDCGLESDASGIGNNANGSFTVDGSSGTSCEIVGYSNVVDGATVTVVVYKGGIDDPVWDGW